MGFARFYGWATVCITILMFVSDVITAVNHGKSTNAANLLYGPAILWLMLSPLFIIATLCMEVPAFLPIFYAVLNSIWILAEVVWEVSFPHTKDVTPFSMTCVDWACEAALLYFSIRYLKSLKPPAKPPERAS